MGATNFSDVGRGKTIESAFANAVKQAHYDYGHSGYSGSIAEKSGAVEFDRVPRYAPEKIERLVFLAMEYVDHGDGHKLTKWATETDEQFKQRKANQRKWDREAKQARETLIKLYGAYTADHMIQVARDKWGPAVVIQKSKNQWYFFGMAPC